MKKFLFFSFLFFFQYTLALAAVPITPNPPPFTEARCLAMQGRCVDNCEDTDGPSPGDCITSAPGTPMAGSGICCVRKDAVASTGKKIGEVQCLAKGGVCNRNCGDTDDISNGACFGGDTAGTFCCIARGSIPVLNITDKASCERRSGSCRPRQLVGSNCPSNEVQGGTCEGNIGNTICCVSSSLASPGATNTGNSGSNNNVPPPGLNYTLLEKLPGSDSTNLSFSAYLSAVYKLAIWIVGLCALFMFLVGAFMYMLSAANTSKAGTAKSIMTDALIGLVLALSSYLILYVINPDLVNLKLPSVSMGGSTGTGTAPGTPLAGAPPAGSGSGCGGLSVSANISSSQCNDASQPLSDLLACIKGKYPEAKITSISDSNGFDKCKNSWSKPPCFHAQTSCHYGGGASQKSSDCNKSHAADFSVKNASGVMDPSIVESLKQAGSACGGRVHDETVGPAPHIHISDQTNCCTR